MMEEDKNGEVKVTKRFKPTYKEPKFKTEFRKQSKEKLIKLQDEIYKRNNLCT
jgi:hypothetical protein